MQTGIELFNKIFKSNFEAHKIWSYALPQLNDTRIEIVTDVQEASMPWELICNPDTLQPLVLGAASFVRTYNQAAVPPKFEKTPKCPIRILLAICRPGGDEDVPFRSVASRVIRALSKEGNSRFQLDVLRPPTFDQLGRILRKAKDEGKPYLVFHFDGHGTYADLSISAGFSTLSRITLATKRSGPCGYLLFENPSQKENMELVDGTRLGNLLREAEVPILVLNACRSAYAESPNEPKSAQDAEQMEAHSRVRAFGSLAQEVMHSGVAGVIAMRYVVYVVTAAQLVAELYDALVLGRTLEEAVNLGRKHLHDQPKREIAFRELELQDWSVPVVFEAGTLALFPNQKAEKQFEIKIRENEAIPDRGYLDPSLPHSPDTGFFGRDETLQAIDRAFDVHKIVLLHSYAGNGKTATAAEFARWYSLTGGVDGPVLFTSFERYMPLPSVLDKIGRVFGRVLEKQGIHWLTLDDDDQKRDLALQVLKQVPVLWIWDNVEPVAGFPMGTESAWSTEERQDLANFLRAAIDTQAKFLITSRRDEREWLGDIPSRISVPPMHMFERIELAWAIADKQGHRMVDGESWKPLLRYTEGNPLTIAILVGQVLREGQGSKDQIEQFVDQLRSGEKDIDDDESLGRSKSLGASLNYGSQNAFDEKDRRILALLSIFQGFANAGALMLMGQGLFSLEELRGLEPEDALKLLDRAEEVGMLKNLGGGHYHIHPALPWFFRGLFLKYYDGREDEVARAFVMSMGYIGNYYFNQYEEGHREVISALEVHEANLLNAMQMAMKSGWLREACLAMQGLKCLYLHTGQLVEWRRLVKEMMPFCVNLKTDGPINGQEEEWNLVTEYQVGLAIQSRQWDEALRIQKKAVEWNREKAGPVLATDTHKIDKRSQNDVRNYITSIATLARIQMEKADAECVQSYKEAIEKSETYSFGREAASWTMNLGNAYMGLAEIHDLNQAEYWFRRGLDQTPESDGLARGYCLGSLGNVEHERFWDTLNAGSPEVKHLEAAWKFYQQALKVIPSNAADELAETHNALAAIYDYFMMFDEALRHYQLAISNKDEVDDIYGAAQIRRNAAFSLQNANRLSDALYYALSALEKFKACGSAWDKEVQETQNLVAELEDALRHK